MSSIDEIHVYHWMFQNESKFPFSGLKIHIECKQAQLMCTEQT